MNRDGAFDFVPEGQMSFDFSGSKNDKNGGKSYSDEKIENAKDTIVEFMDWCEREPSGIRRIHRKFLEEMAKPTSTVSGVWLKEELRAKGGLKTPEDKKYAVDNNHEPVLARVLAKTYPHYGARIRRRRSIYDVPEVADCIPTLDAVGITVV